ncbi:hypothetical protein BC835DRAFT_928687 [Cytidiella melzeri]|nr:hypothetical protein BC835DRAFT_928687 [Cytidiella melzeri]
MSYVAMAAATWNLALLDDSIRAPFLQTPTLSSPKNDDHTNISHSRLAHITHTEARDLHRNKQSCFRPLEKTRLCCASVQYSYYTVVSPRPQPLQLPLLFTSCYTAGCSEHSHFLSRQSRKQTHRQAIPSLTICASSRQALRPMSHSPLYCTAST